MRILLINQPVDNRGDEAAHRSLVRTLNREFPEARIKVAFVGISQASADQMKVSSPNNEYVLIPSQRWNEKAIKIGLRFGLASILSRFHPTHRAVRKLVAEADLVVCAPGGICMGPFQDWYHIYWLHLARQAGKKTAYYSRSFGPFKDESAWDKVFKRTSLELLEGFDFLSIRDDKTMALADTLGVKYVPSIDSALLDTPDSEIPDDFRRTVDGKPYVVYVPNPVTWHVDYRSLNQEYLDSFFLEIADLLLKRFPDHLVVMLPQVYLRPVGDQQYFAMLEKRIGNPRLIALPENYSSDQQQAIIAGSGLVVGARYHSIVFAINNVVPFVALCYEHKMSGLLQILGKEECIFDMERLKKGELPINEVLEEISKLVEIARPDPIAKEKAFEIAHSCLAAFIDRYSR